MLQVELDHILPENDAFDRIREIIAHVEQEKEVYVLTKDGRPVVAIINVDMLQTIPEAQAAVQATPLDSLFNLTPAATAPAPVIPPPMPLPVSAPAAPWSAPAALPPLPPPAFPPMPPVGTPPPAMPSFPPAVPPFQEPTPIAAPTGSILDEPLPPLGGTEFLQPPAQLLPPTPPGQ